MNTTLYFSSMKTTSFSLLQKLTYSGFDKTTILLWKFSPIYMEKESTYWLYRKKANRYLNSCYHHMLLLQHSLYEKQNIQGQPNPFVLHLRFSVMKRIFKHTQYHPHKRTTTHTLSTYIHVKQKYHWNDAVLHPKQSGCNQRTYFSKFCRCSLTFCTRPSLVSLTTKSSQR